MFINLYIARPAYRFILIYTCGLTAVIKRICYVMLCYPLNGGGAIASSMQPPLAPSICRHQASWLTQCHRISSCTISQAALLLSKVIDTNISLVRSPVRLWWACLIFVCVLVRQHISKTTRRIFTIFCVSYVIVALGPVETMVLIKLFNSVKLGVYS